MMNCVKHFRIINKIKSFLPFVIVLVSQLTLAQDAPSIEYPTDLFTADEASTYYEKSIKMSQSGSAYYLMNLRAFFGANNVLLKTTKNPKVIAYQKELIDNILGTAKKSKNIVHNKSPYKDDF